jgi:putative ABC transport system permease protein
MLKNYLKVAMRQFGKQKMYAAIKIGGFAFSIAACLLIALYIRNELSYDKSWRDADRIYRVIGWYSNNGKLEKGVDFPAPTGKTLKANFPEIELSGRIMCNRLMGAGSKEIRPVNVQENTYEEGLAFADQQILDILKVPMIYGDRSKALTEPYTMVISKSKAGKYFPGRNPIGQVMILDNDTKHPYRIGGVMADFPPNSHLQYSFLLTLSSVEFWNGEQNNWGDWNYLDYVLVRPGTNIKQLEAKVTKDIIQHYLLPDMIKGGMKNAAQEAKKFSLHLQRVTDVNLYSYDIQDEVAHGDVRFVWLFGAIAGFILLIACINFINLSTAKSANRAKEVGLRKVVGSYRSSLIGQFLAESIIYSVLSFVLGVLLAFLMLPYFNTLAAKTLTIPWLAWWLFPVIIVSALVVGVAAGVYPAFYLSSFKPVQVLKGSLSTGSKSSILRNGLVVIQFTASIIMIISTLVISKQMNFILHQKVGFDKDQVVMLQGCNTLTTRDVKNLKNELSNLAAVKSVSISDYLPVAGTKRNGNTFFMEGRTRLDPGVSGQFWQVDDTYLKTLGIKLVEGRNFSYDRADDTAGRNVIINQTLAKKLNLKKAIGARITNGYVYTVVGVVQDFNFESMRDHVGPLMLHFGISPSIISVKVRGADMKNTLAAITTTWKNLVPNQPIRYTFLDESFANMYADVLRMGHIFTTFAILAMVIACLGLFALSAFMAEQRSREIGIRKVLGASVSGITTLLSVDFVKLVFIAIIIASPIAWWAMVKWLQGFAYAIKVQWWIFIVAGCIAIFIALFTVSFQSVRAALMNPVKSLRSE